MKLPAILAVCAAVTLVGCSQSSDSSSDQPAAPAPTTSAAAPAPTASGGGDVQLAAFKDKSMEVGCGMCMYHMDGVNRCVTAAMIEGKPMLVSGPHSNAHGLGLCGSKKQVLASGSIVDGTFVATSMKPQ